MSAEFCCSIKSSGFNCLHAPSGFLVLNDRYRNEGRHLLWCLECFILLLPMFLVFSLLLFWLTPSLEFLSLRTLNSGWRGWALFFLRRSFRVIAFISSEVPDVPWEIKHHSLHWTDLLVTHWKGKGHPYPALSQWAGSTQLWDFPVCWALFWP